MPVRFALFAVAACTDPTVNVSFQLPANAEQYDTSCVTAVEVRAIGTNYVQDRTDYTRSCITLQSTAATYADLQSLLHGRFDLDVPASGLAGIAVRGWSGPDACKQSDETDTEFNIAFTSNLVFYAKATYIGQDEIALQAVPNLKCAMTSLKVRVVDMFKLAASGSTANCSAAMTYADNKGWAAAGTMVPALFGKGVDYYGISWRYGTNSLAQLDALSQLVRPGDKSCFALAGANETGASTACVVGGTSVCAGAGELEMAAVDYDVWNQLDTTLKARFPDSTFVSLWNNLSPKTPLGGAKVTVDADHAKVIYLDPPDATGTIHARTDQTATGPSGLVLLYADSLVSAKIDAGAATRTVVLGAPDYTMGGALVVVP